MSIVCTESKALILLFFSEPKNLTVSARPNDSLTLTWLSSSKIDSILYYAATLKHIGESQSLKTLNITANKPCEATFEQLLAYTQFRIAVRACTSVHDCGDAVDFVVSTLPSGKLYTLHLKNLFEITFAWRHTIVYIIILKNKALHWHKVSTKVRDCEHACGQPKHFPATDGGLTIRLFQCEQPRVG